MFRECRGSLSESQLPKPVGAKFLDVFDRNLTDRLAFPLFNHAIELANGFPELRERLDIVPESHKLRKIRHFKVESLLSPLDGSCVILSFIQLLVQTVHLSRPFADEVRVPYVFVVPILFCPLEQSLEPSPVFAVHPLEHLTLLLQAYSRECVEAASKAPYDRFSLLDLVLYPKAYPLLLLLEL